MGGEDTYTSGSCDVSRWPVLPRFCILVVMTDVGPTSDLAVFVDGIEDLATSLVGLLGPFVGATVLFGISLSYLPKHVSER